MKRSGFEIAAMAAVTAWCATGLSGCKAVEETMQSLIPEEKPAYQQTTLQVNADGSLMEEIIETLDESYYSGEELKELVDATVREHEAEYGQGEVSVDAFTLEERAVDLQMTYRDADAYASYNHVTAFNGSMLEAQMEGFLFLQDFRAVTDGVSSGETISSEEPLRHKEYQVLVTDASHAVAMPSRVRYVSANASVADWKLVTPLPAEDVSDGEAGLVLPSSAVYVEAGQAKEVTDEERESGYLYIIYE